GGRGRRRGGFHHPGDAAGAAAGGVRLRGVGPPPLRPADRRAVVPADAVRAGGRRVRVRAGPGDQHGGAARGPRPAADVLPRPPAGVPRPVLLRRVRDRGAGLRRGARPGDRPPRGRLPPRPVLRHLRQPVPAGAPAAGVRVGGPGPVGRGRVPPPDRVVAPPPLIR